MVEAQLSGVSDDHRMMLGTGETVLQLQDGWGRAASEGARYLVLAVSISSISFKFTV